LPPVPSPTFSLGLPTFGAGLSGGWRSLLDIARAAEDAGVDRLIVVDHVVNGPHVDRYPWGRFPTGPDGDWLEPLTVLTAVAAATTHIRLGTGILVAPLRPAALLAKTAATLDVLSGGRLDLGVGTGWQEEELRALGVDPARRGAALTDTIAACRALWAPGPASFSSETVSFEEVYCAPKPVQPRLPVLFSGTLTARNVRRVVELGDGWIPILGSTTVDVGDGVATLREAYEQAGRDAADLQVRHALTPVRTHDGRLDLPATMAPMPELVAAGVTDVTLNLLSLDGGLDDAGPACAAAVGAFQAVLERDRPTRAQR
jgi:probable F420-dependent oxidoreductase